MPSPPLSKREKASLNSARKLWNLWTIHASHAIFSMQFAHFNERTSHCMAQDEPWPRLKFKVVLHSKKSSLHLHISSMTLRDCLSHTSLTPMHTSISSSWTTPSTLPSSTGQPYIYPCGTIARNEDCGAIATTDTHTSYDPNLFDIPDDSDGLSSIFQGSDTTQLHHYDIDTRPQTIAQQNLPRGSSSAQPQRSRI